MTHYYSRSVPEDSDQSHWQKLAKHLKSVANKAGRFSDAFDSREWGNLAGLWHDLGKYQAEFQALLRGEHASVEHSGAGAALAYRMYKDPALALVFAIAGHHAGLANFIESGTGTKPLKERVDQNETVLDKILPAVPSPIIEQVLPKLPDFLIVNGPKEKILRRRYEFWIRFLFSALVDADRLDAEAFSQPERAYERRRFATIVALRKDIDAFIDEKVAALTMEQQSRAVNRARAVVLNACRETAEQSPGLFALTVPTGGGKTLSGMSFALRHAEQHDLRRVIVVIPYTSIIKQNADVYRKALGADSVVEHHSNLDHTARQSGYEAQVASRLELACENWDAPVIVTTNVQFFESLFSNHPSRCRKLHNVARSVIILDEVQMLPPEFLLCILEGLNELVSHYGCTVILSTATPPALAERERFPAGLKNIHQIISLSEQKRLTAELTRVRYHWPKPDEEPWDWSFVAEKMAEDSQVLAIVHKRADARALAMALQTVAPEETVVHLSALMCPAHRIAVIAQIKESLKEDRPCRVVSTQLVEAGVDLDFPVVYRALGGLDSIVQAAGRCNREGKRETGRVVIFPASSSPPQGTPKRAMDITMTLLKESDGKLNLDDPDLFDNYFRRLYCAEHLDAKGVQTDRQKLNFATVGKKFKLIEDGFTHSVVVPYGDAEQRLETLRRDGLDRESLRALQTFIVNIYPNAFKKLLDTGALEEVTEGVFSLTAGYKEVYDTTFGLVVGDEPLADPAALIVS